MLVGSKFETWLPKSTVHVQLFPATTLVGKPALAGKAVSVTVAPGSAWPRMDERSAYSTMSFAKIGDSHSPPGIGPGGGPGGAGAGVGRPQPSARQSPALGKLPPGLGTHRLD